MRGCLIQVSPLDPLTNIRANFRVGMTRNSATLRADGNTWFPAISRMPKISLDLFDANYNGSVQTAKATFTLNCRRLSSVTNKEYLDFLTRLIWEGSPVTIWTGDGPSTSALDLQFVGLVTGGMIDRNTWQIPISCEVKKKLIDVPLLNLEYDGNGGLGGDPEVRGQLRPACFGNPINVPVFFFDQTNWIGQVDGYGNCFSIDTLYEDAASFGPKQANYASYSALAAAAIPEGSWATCVAQGLIRLGANPQGVITTDPACGYGSPGAMIGRWLTDHAGVTIGNINYASLTALDTSLSALLGHFPAASYYTQTQVQVSERIQAMCASVNATWFIGPDGKITVSRAIGMADPVMTFNRLGGKPLVTDWRSLDEPEPWWRLKAEAAKTWRVHSLNEIDYEDDLRDMGNYDGAETYRQGMIVYQPLNGIRYIYINPAPAAAPPPPNALYWEEYQDAVDATTVHYTDGTPVEYLQPAQPGADITGEHAAVGDGNRFRFSKAEKETFGYYGGSAFGTPTITVFAASHVGGDYLNLQGNFTAPNQYTTIANYSPIYAGGSPAFKIPVTPGERIFGSVEIYVPTAPTAARWYLWCEFFDDALTMKGFGLLGSYVGNGTNGDWQRLGGFLPVPAGATFCSLSPRLDNINVGGGRVDIGAFNYAIRKPMVCSAGPAQTQFPDFTPGPASEPGAELNRTVQGPPQSTTFRYTYLGVPETDEFARDLTFKLLATAGQLTADSWSYKVLSGRFNGYVLADGPHAMAGTSLGTLTAVSLDSTVATVEVTALYQGLPYKAQFDVTKKQADPPISSGGGGGGGGGSGPITINTQSDSFGSFNSTSYAVISTLSGVLPAGKTSIDISVGLDATPIITGGAYSDTVHCAVFRNNGGGSFTQIGATQNADSYYFPGYPGEPPELFSATFGFSVHDDNGGAGLTPGATYTYVIEMRTDSVPRYHGVIGDPQTAMVAP